MRDFTVAIVKPDAAKHTVAIRQIAEENGFRVREAVVRHFPRSTFEAFYQEHKGKPFFDDLCDHMSSGPVTAWVLEHAGGGVKRWRELIGATKPKEAAEGTIRWFFGRGNEHVWENVVHGSSSDEAARVEQQLLFCNYY